MHSKFTASAEDLGDVTKDTPDELTERQHRVRAQCLQALQALVAASAPPVSQTGGGAAALEVRTASGALPQTPLLAAQTSEASVENGTSPAPPVAEISHLSIISEASESSASTPSAANGSTSGQAGNALVAPVRVAVCSVLDDATVWDRAFTASADGSTRAAAYSLSSTLALSLPAELSERMESFAPRVFAAVGDREAVCQPALWRMVLRFAATVPHSLQLPEVVDSHPERLFALLSSGEISARGAGSMLPLASLMLSHGTAEWQQPEFATQWALAAAKGVWATRSTAVRATQCTALAELLLFLVQKTEASHAGAGGPLASQVLQQFMPLAVTRSSDVRTQQAAVAVADAVVCGARLPACSARPAVAKSMTQVLCNGGHILFVCQFIPRIAH